jgi:hypothetical protein
MNQHGKTTVTNYVSFVLILDVVVFLYKNGNNFHFLENKKFWHRPNRI